MAILLEIFGNRSEVSFIISLTFSLTFLFFSPIFVYLRYSHEFVFPFFIFCLYLIILAFLFFILLRIICSRLRGGSRRRVLAFLFAFPLLLYVQQNILPWSYGVIGTEIDWPSKFYYGLIDTPIWIVFFLLSLAASELSIKKGCFILLAIQFISILFILPKEFDTPNYKMYLINDDEKYSFSPDQNVILLILDSFPGDIFQELLQEDSSLADVFDGFTFFRNATAAYPLTEPSVFSILTGKYLDFNIPIQPQLKQSYINDSILSKLKEMDYGVHVFPVYRQALYFDNKLISNLSSRSIGDVYEAIKCGEKIYWIATFQSLPHFAKYIYYPLLCKRIFDKLQLSEVKQFENSSLSCQSPLKTFKYYHLLLPHIPLILDDHLVYKIMPFNRENFKKQSKAALKIALGFLKKLKEKNIYDSSTIWLIADHGAGINGLRIRVPEFKYFKDFGIDTSWWQASGIPLLLAKPFRKKGKLQISDAPISLINLKDSILYELNLGPSVRSIFNPAFQEKKRLFFLYEGYDPKLDRYRLQHQIRIRGHSWDSRSWIPDYASFPSALKTYYWGQKILFGKKGNSESYNVWHGFSKPEDNFTWMEGNVASIGLQVTPPITNLFLKFIATPLIAEDHGQQIVTLQINGHIIGTCNLTKRGEYSFEIPKSFLTSTTLEIVFHLPRAFYPKKVGINGEERLLSLAIESLVIEKRN